MRAIFETDLPGLVHRGKVRDTYDLGSGLFLMVASDRISAFDVVLPAPVPGKGAVLAQMSAFWFELTRNVIPNHFVAMGYDRAALADAGVPRTGLLAMLDADLQKRSMVVRKAKRIDMECVVRAYLTGAGSAEYKSKGTLNGAPLPQGLREAERLPDLMFTPSTKAAAGHDEALTRADGEKLVGRELYVRLEAASKAVFRAAHEHASRRGMIIADTKMEFGFIGDRLTLIDELLTPDSSRFWDLVDWKPGASPPAYDKQYVRNWLIESGWNREPPAPALPEEVILRTQERYLEAFRRLTGRSVLL